jgi:hypothetical protein
MLLTEETKMPRPDKEAQGSTVQHSNRATMFYKALAERERDVGKTDVYRIYLGMRKAGQAVTWEETIDFFQRLETAGAGKLVMSRKGLGYTRFHWQTSMKQVATKALGGSVPSPRRFEGPIAPSLAQRAVPIETSGNGDQLSFVTRLLKDSKSSDEDKVRMLKIYLGLDT